MQTKQQWKIKRVSFPAFIILFLTFLVLSTGVACSKLSLFQGVDNSTIKFADVSDVHLDLGSNYLKQRLYGHSKDLLTDAINQINSTSDVELVFFTGDEINTPSQSDFITFLNMINNLKAPWYLTTGNHEIGIFGGLSKQEKIDLINKYNKNNFKIDKSFYSFVPKPGYLFIAMDGVIDDKITSHGYIPDNELNWLDKQLTDNPNSKVVIFQHFPVIEPFKSSTHNLLNADEYLELLNRHKNVVAVISGHYHAAKITKYNNMVFISTPALVEYPDAFRIITITDKKGKIYVKSEFKETRLKDLQQYSKSKSASWQLHYGQPEDRNAEIILDKR